MPPEFTRPFSRSFATLQSVNITISPATPSDLALCVEWMATSEPWLTLRRDREGCERALQRPGTELFIARDAEKQTALGFILIAEHGLAGSPYIASICSAPEARGLGIGSALLNFIEKHFTDKRHLFLLVSSFNLRAQALYRRHGYSQVGELPDYIVPGYSELIFHKSLEK